MRSALPVALVSALVPLLVLTLLPVQAAVAAATPGCRVDHAHYAALMPGMTYRQVRVRLGCDGRRVSHLTVGRVRRATYSWPGRGTYGANITLTFRNDRLTDKSQLGLRAP
ncbi:hypothetical protein R1A27_29805 (plasmid) [Methylobacterium sp. NMS12]|uniref:hypothetical protein n=1 Tax=Methylobacterium sp. NMS12 TaxID=3079766 RepID=UPI003F8822C6